MAENVQADGCEFENPWERLSDQEKSDHSDDECTCVMYQNPQPTRNNVGAMLQKERDQTKVNYTEMDGDAHVKNDAKPMRCDPSGVTKSKYVAVDTGLTEVHAVETLPVAKETFLTCSEDVPDTHVALAWLITVCFNVPLGILALCFSMKATKMYMDGKRKKGRRYTQLSLIASLAGIVLTVVIVMSIVLYLAVSESARRKRGRG